MSKKLRDFIFNTFVVIFILATTLLSLYASGYKFNLKRPIDFNRILVKTGMIDIETEPKNTEIYLNEELQLDPSFKLFGKEQLNTPAKIKNLLPGEYDISLEKDGYWPYQQKITVNSGQTTVLENINLYKSSNPSLKVITKENSNSENLLLSKDNKYLYLKESKEIINLETEEKRDISSYLEDSIDYEVKWCENEMLFIAGYFFSPTKPEKDLDYTILIGNASHFKYQEQLNRIYYINNNSLYYLDISKKQVFSLINNYNFIDYLPEENNIFITWKDIESEDYYLTKYNLEEKNVIKEIKLPKNANYVFGDNNDLYLSLLDNQNKTLYFINKEEIDKGTRKISFLNDWTWLDKYTIFYINDWEINIFNLKNGEKYLINRFSETLNSISLNSTENYIITTSLNNIIVIDLKNNYNTKLLETEAIFSPVLDESNNYLYFWSKLKEVAGIYRIEVK